MKVSDAEQYIADFGKCSYSPLATKAIIEGLLAEIESIKEEHSECELVPRE